MKQAAFLLTLFGITGISNLTNAQTASNSAPVVVPAQYVSSSSPMTDGRVVRAVYDAGSNRTVTSVSEPYRVSQGAAFQAPPRSSASWQTLSPRYGDAAAVTLPGRSTYTAANQTAPPSASRIPVASSAVPATTVYSVYAADPSANYVPVNSPTTVYSAAPDCACDAAQPPVIQGPSLPFASTSAAFPSYPQNTIYKPVLPLRRTIDGAYVSRGIWGQPKAYVPREPVRNFFRYLLP